MNCDSLSSFLKDVTEESKTTYIEIEDGKEDKEKYEATSVLIPSRHFVPINDMVVLSIKKDMTSFK